MRIKKIEILEGGVKIYNVHLVLSFQPKYLVLEMLGFLKWTSTIKIFDTYVHLKNLYWGSNSLVKGILC